MLQPARTAGLVVPDQIGPVRRAYNNLVITGSVERDTAQQTAADALDRLCADLAESALASKASALGWLFGQRKAKPVRGLYIWGEVGRGKTMLMDLFASCVPAAISVRRVHFNAFMNDAHERIFHYRNQLRAGLVKGDDPVGPVAQALARQARLLCFDEFTVTDIADAMLLGRLFSHLFAEGVSVVATSNVMPDRLYENGLNRTLFLPFIALVRQNMDVLKLESRTDYRLEKLSAGTTFLLAQAPETAGAMQALFESLTGGQPVQPRRLAVKGRELVVPQSAMGVARLDFADVCARPLGAADYLALADHFHTVMLENVPVMQQDQRNEAKRFILLIDTLYDRGVKLVMSAEAEPQGLYPYEDGLEAFEFQRTISRLTEMRSHSYLARPHLAAGQQPPPVST